MTSQLRFLIAALAREIDELTQLERAGALVGVIGQLIHALQRERGMSNVMLTSRGARFAAERIAAIADSQRLEQVVREAFDPFEAQASHIGNGARLFSRIAWVLTGLDALPALRERISAIEIDAERASTAFAKLIAGLLGVVFEAADGATDPGISRLLVALFHFMQGKEWAGRERACGGAAFASGRSEPGRQQRWLHLIESQERCFDVFSDFAGAERAAAWRASQPAAELERLRRIGCSASAGSPLAPALSGPWFDIASQRIDAMQATEAAIATELKRLCASQRARLQKERDACVERLPAALNVATDAIAFFDMSPGPGVLPRSLANAPSENESATVYGRQLERSVFDLVREQAHRLQAMSAELDTVRAALSERKLVERAKGLLMAHRQLSEDQAHHFLRQSAMNQNRRLIEVAESVIAMADLLPAHRS